MKVYVIEANISGSIADAVSARNELGIAISSLAKMMNEPVWFHDYKDPVAGAPVVLLECSAAFLKIARQMVFVLTRADKIREVQPGVQTERSPRLQSYFAGKPAKPSAPKPPGA